jgi:hypothetical protein
VASASSNGKGWCYFGFIGDAIVFRQRLMMGYSTQGSNQSVVLGRDEIHQFTCSADTKKGESA